MAAAIRRHYAELAQLPAPDAPAELPPIPGLPTPLSPEAAPGPSAFELTYQQWMGEQSRRANPRSGLRLSKSYLDSLQNTLVVLRAYAATAGPPLTLLGMDRTFYVAFQEYFLGQRSQSINTFGKHGRALKNFLGWAEDQDLPVNPKYRRFEAPDIYQGADALSQAELLALAATRFDTPQAYAYVQAASRRSTPRPRPPVRARRAPAAARSMTTASESACARWASPATSCCNAAASVCASPTPTASRPATSRASWPACAPAKPRSCA